MRGDGYAAFDLDEHFTVWPAELYLDRHDLVLLTSKLNGQVHVAVRHREAECSDSSKMPMTHGLPLWSGKA